MDLVTTLEQHQISILPILIGCAVAVAIFIGGYFLALLTDKPPFFTAGIIVSIALGIAVPLVAVVPKMDARADAVAEYLHDEHHLTATDTITVTSDHRAITKVLTADGDIKWAELNWVTPDDIHNKADAPDDYDPVSVTLTDTKPSYR